MSAITYAQFAERAEAEGLTAAIRFAMAHGMTRADVGKWELQFIKAKSENVK